MPAKNVVISGLVRQRRRQARSGPGIVETPVLLSEEVRDRLLGVAFEVLTGKYMCMLQ